MFSIFEGSRKGGVIFAFLMIVLQSAAYAEDRSAHLKDKLPGPGESPTVNGEFVHNVGKRGKALLHSLIELLVK